MTTIDPKRGDAWWVDIDPTRGSEIRKTRPCLVITDDTLNLRRRTVVVVPLSTSPKANPPLQIAIRSVGSPAVAVVDQIRAVSKDRLIRQLGTIASDELTDVEAAIRDILDL